LDAEIKHPKPLFNRRQVEDSYQVGNPLVFDEGTKFIKDQFSVLLVNSD